MVGVEMGSKVKKSKRRKVEGWGVGYLLVLNGSESRSGPKQYCVNSDDTGWLGGKELACRASFPRPIKETARQAMIEFGLDCFWFSGHSSKEACSLMTSGAFP